MSDRFQRLAIGGVPVDHTTVDQLIDAFVDWSVPESPTRHVCYLNAHVHNLARRDPALNHTLQSSALCYPDGASIVWASRLLGRRLPARMTAADFVPDLMCRLVAANRRIFLLGGSPGVAESTAFALAREVPGFQPVGCAHGYFQAAESDELIKKINAVGPDVLAVGMGSPRQEHWIGQHGASLKVPLIWAVGALFDYSAGRERRCPRWMGDSGLEWLFRLTVNPRRMASRYLFGNPRFVCSVLRTRLLGQRATRSPDQPNQSAAPTPLQSGLPDQ